jgi:FXSXX-COOH protein
MPSADDTPSEYATDLADIRRVPLADVPGLNAGLLGDTLGRLMPTSPAGPVPVASFNSAI